jgi:hypothetical protein
VITASPGVHVARDGVDVTSLVGVEDPVDPGTYHVTAEADGYQPWATDVTTREGATVTVEVPPLDAVEVEHVEAPVPIPEPPEKRRALGGGRRIMGMSIAGVGLVSTAVGLVFGARANSKWGEAHTICGDDLNCPTTETYDAGHQAASDARAAGNLSTIFVGVGVVAIAAGVVVYLTAPHGTVEVAPSVGSGSVAITARGSF